MHRFVPDDDILGVVAFGPAVFEAHNESLQGYVFHCHILDHEDNEMMRPMHIEGQ